VRARIQDAPEEVVEKAATPTSALPSFEIREYLTPDVTNLILRFLDESAVVKFRRASRGIKGLVETTHSWKRGESFRAFRQKTKRDNYLSPDNILDAANVYLVGPEELG